MADVQIETHLRKYAEDSIQQKIRLQNLITDYQAQSKKSQDRIIDEKAIIAKVTEQGISQNRIDLMTDRQNRDETIFAYANEFIRQCKEDMAGLTMRLTTHMEELTEIELTTGGFITHAIGVDTNAVLDKDTMIVNMQPDGHIEIPIGARLNKWKDSSQLVVKKIKKAGA